MAGTCITWGWMDELKSTTGFLKLAARFGDICTLSVGGRTLLGVGVERRGCLDDGSTSVLCI